MDKHKAKVIKVDDAKGHTVIPSLFDSHIHVIRVVADEKVRSISLLLTITDGNRSGGSSYATYALRLDPVVPAWIPVRHFGGHKENKLY
jgi:hypothetical protein